MNFFPFEFFEIFPRQFDLTVELNNFIISQTKKKNSLEVDKFLIRTNF